MNISTESFETLPYWLILNNNFRRIQTIPLSQDNWVKNLYPMNNLSLFITVTSYSDP